MTPGNDACSGGDGASSRQNRRDAANVVASTDADDSQQKDKHVAGSKRQAVIDTDGQHRQHSMKPQDIAMADHVLDANNIPGPVEVRSGNSNTWQSTNVVGRSHNGTGWVTRSDPSTTEGQKLWQILAEMLAKRSHTNEVIAYMTTAIDETRATFKPSALCAMTELELELAIENANHEIRHSRYKESVRQSTSDRDKAAADIGREAPRAGPLTGPGHAWYPDWQEVLDSEELSKSRFLEDEPALNFLRSLEPKIIDESHGYFGPHTQYLHLARMANIAERRERFQEYLVEAPREWYCLTTVCKQGYENENAVAVEENCECSQRQKTCLQVRIRRGKLGAFDVRFR